MRNYYITVSMLTFLVGAPAFAQSPEREVPPPPVVEPGTPPDALAMPAEPAEEVPDETDSTGADSDGDRGEVQTDAGAELSTDPEASPEAVDGNAPPSTPRVNETGERADASASAGGVSASEGGAHAGGNITSHAPAAPTSSPEYKVYGAPGKGATLEFGAQFSLNVRARIQVRYQLDVPAEDALGDREPLQTVNIGTARLWFSGHAYTRDLTYMVQLAVAARDYRDGATSPVYDAYIDYRAHRDFAVKVGQYFVPFDRLRTVREFALQMGDRPIPVQQLTLDRDVGITVYSDNFLADNSPLALRIGAFGGSGIHQSLGKEPGVLVVGRVELRPLGKIDDDSEGDLERRPKPAIALGAAVARNWNTNRVRSTTGAIYAEGSVDYLHAATDLVFKWRGVALQGELLLRDADTDTTQAPAGAPRGLSQSGRGWVAQASYTFDPPFEIVGRMSGLYALSGTDPAFVALAETAGREVAAGLNYYINGHKAKIQTDWISRFPGDYDLEESQHTAHVQLDVTF